MSSDRQSKLKKAGYAELIDRYELDVIPNWHTSWVAASGTHKVTLKENIVEEIYPSKYQPRDTLGDHLEFALKYDGINLGILAALFKKIEEKELVNYISSKPTGKYARRIWFLYEFLTNRALPIKDLNQGNYVDLLDPKKYYTSFHSRRVQRQRINDNLLGNSSFCPIVRRTDILKNFEQADFNEQCRKIVSTYSPTLLKRAVTYLYTKETKSSFEIEHIKPSSTRTERFISLLRLAETEDFCEKSRLIDLQNRIVDPRFKAFDYRTTQNYVGQAVAWQQEKIHFVCPKPEDINDLMEGLTAAHKRMNNDKVHPVIHAAAIAYGFVFLHPFEDGNGRIHRFLIHNILARRNFTPKGIMFPISAAMLRNQADYDASLEAFSCPLMTVVEYTLDENGHMTVHNDTATWYRYIDMTPQAEALFSFIKQTINTELTEELSFLADYDQTKKAIQEIVDMPDRQIDQFIRFCLQNNGRLSANKRTNYFNFLSDNEINQMEQIVRSLYKTPKDHS